MLTATPIQPSVVRRSPRIGIASSATSAGVNAVLITTPSAAGATRNPVYIRAWAKAIPMSAIARIDFGSDMPSDDPRARAMATRMTPAVTNRSDASVNGSMVLSAASAAIQPPA